MTDLSELLERVKAATGPDRELDAAVFNARPPIRLAPYLPELTASVDAALAFVERVLPREWPAVIRDALQDMANRFDWHICFPRDEQFKLLPLAIIAATLTALLSQEPDHDHQ